MGELFDLLLLWTPVLAAGFMMNIWISINAMALGTVIGLMVGLGRATGPRWLQIALSGVTHFSRNTPSLILLFYLAYLLPFEVTIFGIAIPIPGWAKAIFGLSIPVIGFMSDNVLGAVRGIEGDQWDAADALGYGRWGVLTKVVLPQTVPMLLPPWMSYFAIIVMASSTASMVGVKEIIATATVVMDTTTDPGLIIPVYLYVLCWFFAFCYPFSHLTRWMERRRWRRNGKNDRRRRVRQSQWRGQEV